MCWVVNLAMYLSPFLCLWHSTPQQTKFSSCQSQCKGQGSHPRSAMCRDGAMLRVPEAWRRMGEHAGHVAGVCLCANCGVFFLWFLVSVRTVHLKQKTSVYENVFCLGKRQIKEVKVCASVTEENPDWPWCSLKTVKGLHVWENGACIFGRSNITHCSLLPDPPQQSTSKTLSLWELKEPTVPAKHFASAHVSQWDQSTGVCWPSTKTHMFGGGGNQNSKHP